MDSFDRLALICAASLLVTGCSGSDGRDGVDGKDGAPGISTLLNIIAEPAGENCPAGGNRIEAGPDTDADGVLDATEANTIRYVCNGSDGEDGAAGQNGTLIDIAAEPAGPQCTHGGSKITAGADANANGQLDAEEVTSTRYICNGAPGPGVTWVEVTDGPVQAESNIGYIIRDDSARVDVTLPANPAVGDVISVSGVGAGGWRILQNAGQRIQTNNIPAYSVDRVWTEQPSPPWPAVPILMAWSSDGSRILLMASGDLYLSENSGATWTTSSPSTAADWSDLASSDDGNRLVAAPVGDSLFVSSDGGVNWTPVSSLGAKPWQSVATSADGSRLVAVAYDEYVYTSSDFGATWTAKLDDQTRPWLAAAMSADGTHIVVGGEDTPLFASTDGGVTWVETGPTAEWWDIASSADGSRLVAVSRNGGLHTSTDGGLTWTAGLTDDIEWTTAAMSRDGRTLVAAGFSSAIMISTDYGASWRPGDSVVGTWSDIVCTSDCSKIAAVRAGGYVTTSPRTKVFTTTPGTDGFLQGSQWDAIDLQYVGGGLFIVKGAIGSYFEAR
ncbi:MAG TPA: YCF48-related protein [Gammaproteobacteria bacterium]